MPLQSQTLKKTSILLKAPKMYAVVMFNDDITTMDFVVDALVRIFHKSPAEASAIMMSIHNSGKGIAGVYTFDIATTKKNQTEQFALEKGFPLKLRVEEANE